MDEEKKKTVEGILEHEIYSKLLQGVARTDGILGELMGEDFIDEDTYKSLLGKEIELNSVEDVEKLLG